MIDSCDFSAAYGDESCAHYRFVSSEMGGKSAVFGIRAPSLQQSCTFVKILYALMWCCQLDSFGFWFSLGSVRLQK